MQRAPRSGAHPSPAPRRSASAARSACGSTRTARLGARPRTLPQTGGKPHPRLCGKRNRDRGFAPMPCRPPTGRLPAMFSPSRSLPMTATTAIFTPLRELAHRTADGIDVTLMWDPVDDRAFVTVVDMTNGVVFDVEVGDESPMQVFHHPYAYCDLDVAA